MKTTPSPMVAQDDRIMLQNFLKRINQFPNPAEILENKHAGNSRYLPISFIEMALDEYFFGLWEVTNFRWERMGNELVGSVDLRVFHPTAQIWITRTGASATMIRLKKDSASYELENKIHNALEMDFPHLKADCLRNAAQSIGKLFGRDLNRKFEDIYKPLIHQHEIENGAQTRQLIEDSEISRAVGVAEQKLEFARMDDQTELAFKLRLSRAERVEEVWQIVEEIKMYIPESNDPKQQFKNLSL